MNHMFFWLKRAFQSSLRVTRRWMARLRMTAARFDMLKAIESGRDGLWQSELPELLGVTPQTISRMLRALEERRLIRRERDVIVDGRRLWVSLTNYGRTVLGRVQKVFVSSGAIALILECAVLPAECVPDREERLSARLDAEAWLQRIRCGLHDRSTLYSGWSREP
ncbi:MAG: winged helix-turn-helix transcriptional regulator, partial [Myxococcales bacterium]|nr:winged helix-turn-helix transcriptional regulator [Myxococcales bacterium]